MPPVLNQLNIVVRDMQASVDFYRRLGLAVDPPPNEWAAHHVEVHLPGDLTLELDSTASAKIWNSGAQPLVGNRSVIIGFGLSSRDEVDELYAHMTAGGYVGQLAPYDAFWGARYAIVEDPDGNGIGLMSPSEPNRRRSWPDPNAVEQRNAHG